MPEKVPQCCKKYKKKTKKKSARRHDKFNFGQCSSPYQFVVIELAINYLTKRIFREGPAVRKLLRVLGKIQPCNPWYQSDRHGEQRTITMQ